MNLRSLSPLLALLLATAACSDDSGVTPDAAVEGDSGTTPLDAPANDVPAGQDVPRLDAPDAPRADVPATDVPTTDVPATDVPTTDVPVTDAGTDVPATDAGTDVPAVSDACTRPDIGQINTRQDCRTGGDSACPAGYSCLSMSGIVLQRFCGRPCRSDCDCATGDVCGSYTDKAGTHPLCVNMTSTSR
ncbi:MAG: hypothetical protein JWM10_5442 [Myxococcaceae bacterium]|nr:hypothetical protein [Myxococcaceae bacterium]